MILSDWDFFRFFKPYDQSASTATKIIVKLSILIKKLFVYYSKRLKLFIFVVNHDKSNFYKEKIK